MGTKSPTNCVEANADNMELIVWYTLFRKRGKCNFRVTGTWLTKIKSGRIKGRGGGGGVLDTRICMNIRVCMYSQPIPRGVTFSNAVSKLKAQSSNVSFH